MNTPDIDPSIYLLALFRRQQEWWLCPYGEWTEADGARVIFDRKYRPIVRVRLSRATEIVEPDTHISYLSQRFYHTGFGPHPSAKTREIVARIIEAYELKPELRRRRQLLKEKKLKAWDPYASLAQ